MLDTFEATKEKVIRKNTGIAMPNKKCGVCGIRAANLVKVKGTGTSRINPTRWVCREHA